MVLLREASPDYQQSVNLNKLVLIFITFFYQFALTLLAFSIDYSAVDIRQILEKGDSGKQAKGAVYLENC